MSNARLMMIRHWHLRNGHKPRDGQDYCEGCAHEMDDLIKHMNAAGLVIVPKEPTREMLAKGATSLVNDQEHRGVLQLAVSPAFGVWRAMVEAANEQ